MIEIKFQGQNMQELLASVADFIDTVSPYDTKIEGPTSPATPTAAPAKRTRTPKAEAPAAAGQVGQKTAPTPALAGQPTTATPAGADSAPKLADAQTALTAYFTKNGLGPSRELLQKFGVGKVQELKPEAFAAFILAAAV